MTEPIFRSDVTVQLVKHAASDSDVLWAARVSTQGERSIDERGKDEARSTGLIKYLMRSSHGTPFEHSSMTFLITAPIMVFREFHRHRAGWSYSEESGRYRQLRPVFYVPAEDRNLVQVGKPGHYQFIPGTRDQHDQMVRTMKESYWSAFEAYQSILDQGVAREMARAVLPVATYSSMYATCNARSLMHFLSLRTSNTLAAKPSTPQWEIEMVATEMENLWSTLMPVTWAAFNEYERQAP